MFLLSFASRKGKASAYLADMIAMTQLAVAWAVSAAAVVFLIVCAWHNRRSGYQGKRPDVSGIEDALGWLVEFRASLSPDDDVALPARAVPLERNPVLG